MSALSNLLVAGTQCFVYHRTDPPKTSYAQWDGTLLHTKHPKDVRLFDDNWERVKYDVAHKLPEKGEFAFTRSAKDALGQLERSNIYFLMCGKAVTIFAPYVQSFTLEVPISMIDDILTQDFITSLVKMNEFMK